MSCGCAPCPDMAEGCCEPCGEPGCANSFEPWDVAAREMRAAGYEPLGTGDREHLWADGLLLFWHRKRRLPLADELCWEMVDEWDDPVSLLEADRALREVAVAGGRA